MLGEPGLRDSLLRPREPRLGDEILQLLAVEPGEVGDAQGTPEIVVQDKPDDLRYESVVDGAV